MNDEVQKKSKGDLEMETALFELRSTKAWIAIKRYITLVSANAAQITLSIDPFKSPSDICKNQGIRYGLQSFENYVDTLKNPNDVINEEDK
jgi:hypothetical protein